MSPARPFVSADPGGNVALDLFVLGQHLGSLLEAALADTGLSPSQYAVYSSIASGTHSPKALLQALGLRPATLSGYLGAMESAGDLERSRDPEDRRAHRLALTTQGAARVAAARAAFRGVLQSVDAELGGPEAVVRARTELGRVDRALTRALDGLGG